MPMAVLPPRTVSLEKLTAGWPFMVRGPVDVQDPFYTGDSTAPRRATPRRSPLDRIIHLRQQLIRHLAPLAVLRRLDRHCRIRIDAARDPGAGADHGVMT